MRRYYSSRLWAWLFAALALAWLGYQSAFLPWSARWGASDDEVAAAMPGDAVVAHPRLNVTRAITLDAPPEIVWPWLVQIGTGRAGWYSYDCLDNGCHPSAESILSQFQGLKRGDKVPLSPDGKAAFTVQIFEKNRVLGLGGVDPRVQAIWVMQLKALPSGQTRLILRLRLALEPAWIGVPLISALRPAHFIMERKMLHELKRRLARKTA